MAITHEQADLLESTGLLDACNEVWMNIHEKKYDWLKERWKGRTNIHFSLFEGYEDWYEATTELMVQKHVHDSKPQEYYVCHITHKGASHGPGGHQNWRKYMQYWNIERWRDCVAKLDEGYDMCGASFLNNPPHPFYAGNFYWAKASYLRRCNFMETPEYRNFQPQFSGQPHHRFDWECWHGSGQPNAFDLHPGPGNRWYLPPEAYREDMKDMFIYRS
jgi:hypothetical protein